MASDCLSSSVLNHKLKPFEKMVCHVDLIRIETHKHTQRQNMPLCNLFSLDGGFDNVGERKPFRWFHGGVNAAGYAVGFVAGENTGAGGARGKCFTLPVNKHTLLL